MKMIPPGSLAYVLSGAALSACTSPQLPVPASYTHPSYGVVTLPDTRYVKDRMACKQEVYGAGVLVDGNRETDPGRIDGYLADAYHWYFQEVQAIRSTKRAAAIGYAAGMRVAGINTPVMLPYDYGLENPSMPEQYQDVLRANGDVNRCLTEKGWRRI